MLEKLRRLSYEIEEINRKFDTSRRELCLDVSVGVHILLVVEQLSLESQSRGCAKTPIPAVYCQEAGMVKR